MSDMKITPVKGRPMLHWIGKKPLEAVRHYPAQLSEAFGVNNPPAEPTYANFKKSGGNLLFNGDNKEVLSSLLIAGFRGKVDLIYIDPPFDSGADYVRRVQLRGVGNGNGGGKLSGAGQSLVEQTQYEDIWANDNYLQFMYERLILLRELLSDTGNIFLQADDKKGHYLKILLDEVMGQDNYVNDIVWRKGREGGGGTPVNPPLPTEYQNIYLYAKHRNSRKWNAPRGPYSPNTLSSLKTDEKGWFYMRGRMGRQPRQWEIEAGVARKTYVSDNPDESKQEVIRRLTSEGGKFVLLGDVWDSSLIKNTTKTDYPTEKPEELLEIAIKAGTNEGEIVLDCFCGSGTTAAVAEKLGRRWIAADLNKGAIQTTSKRLQDVINGKNGDLMENGRGFIHYRVNNYDFAQQNGLKKIVISKYGVRKDNGDLFFDGRLGDNLVKIVGLDRPLNRLDLQSIEEEIRTSRPDETRDIVVFCNGCELGVIAELDRRRRPVNNIIVRDIQKDGITTEKPAEAEVSIAKRGKKVNISILDYISPSILARMELDRTIFNEQIDDFRAQIDCALFDTDYNGKHFNIVESDVPGKKSAYVRGDYEFAMPRPGARVAVKIIDMLGEETIIVK